MGDPSVLTRTYVGRILAVPGGGAVVVTPRMVRLRVALAAMLAVPISPAPGAVPAWAHSGDGPAGTLVATTGRTEAMITLPAALAGRRPVPGELRSSHDGRDLPVLSYGPGPVAATDVVVVLRGVDADRAVTAALSRAGTVLSAVLDARGHSPPASPPGRPADLPDGLGPGTLLLSFALGLVGLGVLLAGLATVTGLGGPARRALGELLHVAYRVARECGRPDSARTMPRAEVRRRVRDARADLSAVVGDGRLAKERAHEEALLADVARTASIHSAAAARERLAAHDQARQRRDRSMRRRVELMAVECARRQRSLLERGFSDGAEPAEPGPTAGTASGGPLPASARARLAAAAALRAELERAAADALLVAREEEEALAAARLERERLRRRPTGMGTLPAQAVTPRAVAPTGRSGEPVGGPAEPGVRPDHDAAPPPHRLIDLRDPTPGRDAEADRPEPARTRAGASAGPRRAAAVAAAPAPGTTSRPGPLARQRPAEPTEDPAPAVQPPQEPSRPAALHHTALRRVAWGAPVVRATTTSYRSRVRMAAVTVTLLHGRDPGGRDRALRTAAWLARGCLLLLVPAVLLVRQAADPGWAADVVGSPWAAARAVLAISLTAAGTWRVWRGTAPPYPLLRSRSATPARSYQRASEQVALRLAAARRAGVGWSPADALTEPGGLTSEQVVAAGAQLPPIRAGWGAVVGLAPFIGCVLVACSLLLV
jgi:hypothetical protein